MQFEKNPYRQIQKSELLYIIGILEKRIASVVRFFHIQK